MSINFNELRELLKAISQTDIAEVMLKTESFELIVRRGTTVATGGIAIAVPSVSQASPAELPTPSVKVEEPKEVIDLPTPAEQKWVAIASPMVGTFYLAPAPGEASFVEVGDRIRSGQTVCIIEAMKLMNEIEAEITGQVIEIAVANGEPVEYGQTLMRIDPS